MSNRTLQGKSFLILKCRAERIPLRDNSVRLALATPPYLGAPRVRQEECPTQDKRRYKEFLRTLVEEAGRILRPGGHLLLHTGRCPVKRVKGARRIEFFVLRKPKQTSRQTPRRVGTEWFATQFTRVQGIRWVALGVSLYRELVCRYSEPGDLVADVFSGSGNAALAALLLLRKPILIDLHHHRKVRERLEGALRRERRRRGSARWRRSPKSVEALRKPF